jgi:hypothetical protein
MPCGIQSKTLSLFDCGGTLFRFGTFYSCVRNILYLEIGNNVPLLLAFHLCCIPLVLFVPFIQFTALPPTIRLLA